MLGTKKILLPSERSSHHRSLRSSRNDSLEVINRRRPVAKRGKTLAQSKLLDSKRFNEKYNESSEVKLSHDYAHSEDPIVVGHCSEMLMEVTSNVESAKERSLTDLHNHSQSNSSGAQVLAGQQSDSLLQL